MSDLISRKAAIEKNEMLYRDVRDDTSYMTIGYNHALSDMKAIIKSLPSAQPELIRCKDCKWYEIYQLKKDGTEDRRHRPSYCVILSYKTRPDWFCADGERREDEAD